MFIYCILPNSIGDRLSANTQLTVSCRRDPVCVTYLHSAPQPQPLWRRSWCWWWYQSERKIYKWIRMCVPHIWLIALLVTETNKSKSNNVTAVSVLCCMSACALRKIVCAAVCVCRCRCWLAASRHQMAPTHWTAIQNWIRLFGDVMRIGIGMSVRKKKRWLSDIMASYIYRLLMPSMPYDIRILAARS